MPSVCSPDFIDAIAGGGGLLSIPALLAAGIPPAAALATNKLQSSFGALSATIKFVRRGEVHPGAMRTMILCTFVGSALGAILVQLLDSSFLRDVIPILLIGIALYLLLSPKAGDIDAQQRIGEHAFALSIGTGIGFYDGFFGPGTGTFFAIAFVSLLGHNLRKATAHTKVVNLTSNLAALLFFIVGGHVLWTVGLLMGAGQYIGAQLGAHMVIRNGARVRSTDAGGCLRRHHRKAGVERRTQHSARGLRRSGRLDRLTSPGQRRL